MRDFAKSYGTLLVGTILLLSWVVIRSQDVTALRNEDEKNQAELISLKKSMISQKKSIDGLAAQVRQIRDEQIRNTAKIEDLSGRR
jgi:hypothetical protein